MCVSVCVWRNKVIVSLVFCPPSRRFVDFCFFASIVFWIFYTGLFTQRPFLLLFKEAREAQLFWLSWFGWKLIAVLRIWIDGWQSPNGIGSTGSITKMHFDRPRDLCIIRFCKRELLNNISVCLLLLLSDGLAANFESWQFLFVFSSFLFHINRNLSSRHKDK